MREMELYDSNYREAVSNQAPAQQPLQQQQQIDKSGGMLGQMTQGVDWQNLMPGLGMNMQGGQMNQGYDLSNQGMFSQNLPYQSMQGGFGAGDAYSRSFGLGQQQQDAYSGAFGLGQQQPSMLGYGMTNLGGNLGGGGLVNNMQNLGQGFGMSANPAFPGGVPGLTS